jgi:hypothetical protein
VFWNKSKLYHSIYSDMPYFVQIMILPFTLIPSYNPLFRVVHPISLSALIFFRGLLFGTDETILKQNWNEYK